MGAPALPLSGPPFPRLSSRVAAESFGVRCILRGTPRGALGSGDLGTPGSPGGGQQALCFALPPSASRALAWGLPQAAGSPRPWPDPQTPPLPTSQGPLRPGPGRCGLHEWVGLAGSAVAPAWTAWAASMAGPGPASEPQSALGGPPALPASSPSLPHPVPPAVTLFRWSPTRHGGSPAWEGRPAPGRDTDERHPLQGASLGPQPGVWLRQPGRKFEGGLGLQGRGAMTWYTSRPQKLR